ncbi:MAG: hypothetical protein HKN46_04275 [Acidimicrobiia bacterium]|nr:hypothetical protein [Acidimicrobiia bacterium]
MEFIGYLLVAVGVAAIAYGVFASRRRPDAAAPEAGAVAAPETVSEMDHRIRPSVRSFHVEGEVAKVDFSVPVPAGGADAVLTELLEYEAIEVLREKSRNLPIDQVTKVVALASGTEVGSVELPSAGELPPEMEPPVSLHLDAGDDPLLHTVSPSADAAEAGAPSSDTLPPLGSEIRIPAAVEAGLRTVGVDVLAADAPEFVRGLVTLHRYSVEERDDRTYLARKGGVTTLVRNIAHGANDYPELDEGDIRGFVADFIQSGADRGMLVTAKYAPFAIYERERSEPRIQFISRERMQGFVDRMATS